MAVEKLQIKTPPYPEQGRMAARVELLRQE